MAADRLAQFRLTPAARNDLEDIWRYSASTWSIEQADHYIDGLEESFNRLLLTPEMTRERTEFVPPVRIYRNAQHLIVYRIEADYLAILRVLGGRQDWQAILRAIDG
ncbi:MAG: type II toxin-antitoxin system RelE/ParE family toxin [Sphingomonadaceae bacterium]